MKKAIGALALFLLVALGLSTPAHAATTAQDCRVARVDLTDRADTGNNGSVWAKDTMTRTVRVCVEEVTEGQAKYHATVTDRGTFNTVPGKSPNKSLTMPGGIEGTVTGSFESRFTGPLWSDVFKLETPGQDTSSGTWVQTAMRWPSAIPIEVYRWTYTTACETYRDNNGVPTGDITSRCVTPKVPTHTPPTCNKTGTVKSPEQEGVTYTAKRNVENGVTVSATVTATPGEGYAFPKDATTTWTYPVALLTGKVCESPSPSPSSPTPSPSKSTQSPGTTPTHTGAPTDPVDPSTSTSTASGELPVTGPSSPIGVLAAGGVLILSGVGMLVGLRMRRKAIEG